MKISNQLSYGRFVIWAATKKISHKETEIIWRKLNLRQKIKKCDPTVGFAIKNFSRLFTTSHTTKSKLHSVWDLVRNNVQKSFSDYVTEYRRTHINYELRVLVRTPNKDSSFALRLGMDKIQNFGLAEAMRTDMRNLENLFGFYMAPNCIRKSEKIFQETLESIRYLCNFCQASVPIRTTKWNGSKEKKLRKTVRPVRDEIQYPYCELCYNLCQRADSNFSMKGVLGSMRFCTLHDSGNPNSKYRTDYGYKNKFQEKIKEIFSELPQQSEKWVKLAGDFDMDSIRRYAYYFVRARPVGNRLEVTKLSNEGCSNVEIARILGISRQMVHKILNNPLKRPLGRTAEGTIIFHLREEKK